MLGAGVHWATGLFFSGSIWRNCVDIVRYIVTALDSALKYQHIGSLTQE
jgi:hypothetical protein